jgi:two-component system osmolarity sensor histidine kinase EnvZ
MALADGGEQVGRPEIDGSLRRRARRLLAWQVVACIAALGVVAHILMEQHWDHVTRRLSEALARDIAAIIDLYEESAGKDQPARQRDTARLIELAGNKFGFSVSVLEGITSLPAAQPKPFFDVLDRALSQEIGRFVRHPFWIDTVGQSRAVEVRIKTGRDIVRVVAPRSRAYASNSHIFLIWMLGTSILLVAFSLVLLRSLPSQQRTRAAEQGTQ